MRAHDHQLTKQKDIAMKEIKWPDERRGRA
jgi:hypothetical protein